MEPQKDKQTGLNIYNLGLFSKDPFSAFLYRKSQNLTAALYLITDYFPKEEPLKWNIRDRANFLLQSSLSFSFVSKEEQKELTENILSSSIEILSLAEIGFLTKLISEMNFNVLKKEFENLLIVVEKEREPFKLGINFLLDESVFKSKDPVTWPKETKKEEQPKPKGQILIKDTKSDRKQMIIDLLKGKSDLSIKDISQAFPDCSEKTIQRELIQMTENGILRRIGERRWSRYSLISQV